MQCVMQTGMHKTISSNIYDGWNAFPDFEIHTYLIREKSVLQIYMESLPNSAGITCVENEAQLQNLR